MNKYYIDMIYNDILKYKIKFLKKEKFVYMKLKGDVVFREPDHLSEKWIKYVINNYD